MPFASRRNAKDIYWISAGGGSGSSLVITYQARLVGTLKRRHRRLETQFRRDKTRLDPNITALQAVE